MREPAYLKLHRTGELRSRADRALGSLERCRVCPWDCEIDRLENEKKVCKTGRYARVSSYFPHSGEENCLRGWKGSGTIFFAGCNLRCVFCQNFDISQTESGMEVGPEGLAEMMLELQDRGCHNINLVTPEHVVPQILEALAVAIPRGLSLPLVYNTGGFDSRESLRQMDGIVDIYMPDFKYWSEEKSKRLLKTDKYPGAARAALKEMHRQVGDLELDRGGLAIRGVLVRHLVMPGALDETREILRFLSRELSPMTFVNLMAQYSPAGRVNRQRYDEINRRITTREFVQAVGFAKEAGLERLDERAASFY